MEDEFNEKEVKLKTRLENLEKMEQEVLQREKVLKEKEKSKNLVHEEK